MPDLPDFSSQVYWSTRFKTESSFEWLVQSNEIIPLILDSLPRSSAGHKSVKVLHLGCGTSSLGAELDTALRGHLASVSGGDVPDVKVVDTDYVVPPCAPGRTGIEFRQCDIIDLASLRKISVEQWDVVVDKSTADAISCGPSITIATRVPDSQGDPSESRSTREPIEVMCDNLAQVIRTGGRWICVSYSQTRFDHLSPDRNGESGWKVIQKKALRKTTGQRVIREGKVERVVYEPSTSVWAYVLERV